MKKSTPQLTALDAQAILALHATFFSHNKLEEASVAYVTELALKLDFKRVSVGLIDDDSVKVIAVSHEGTQQQAFEYTKLLSAAMDESFTQASRIQFPVKESDSPKIILAHAALSQYTNHQLLTVPLVDKQRIIGAMLFEIDRSNSITSDEISIAEQMTALFAPLIHLKQQANLTFSAKLMQRIKSWFTFDEDHAFKKYAMLGGLLILLGLLFIPISHRVGAPAKLEGLIQRALVAPEDGFLQQSYVRPGDKIKAHQLLAELADQDLVLEQVKNQSEYAQYENAYGAALAGSDRVQMMINQSKMEEINAKLALIKQKIERSKITAPFDGVVIKGDLKQSLGAPVQKGDALLTVAPAGQFRLIVEVDERDIDLVTINQKGVVVLVSMPDEKIPFTVKNLTPIATSKEGRTFFEVEGILDNAAKFPNLQPGMEGVAKINSEKATLFWIWTHRVWDWFKITWWSWGW